MGATYGKTQWGLGKYSADANEVPLFGDLAPQVALAGSLTANRALSGDLTPNVVFAATAVFGPLWGQEICPPTNWEPTEPCPPPMWTPVPPPTFVPPSGGWTEPEKVDDLPVWGNAKK